MSKNTTTHNSAKRPKNKLGYIDPTVAGIDIGNEIIVMALPDGKNGAIIREFGTTTMDLQEIRRILEETNIETAVMEATGVYWIPLFEILEDSKSVRPVLVDAKDVKNKPGRKTDILDCQWIQTCWSNGMLTAAFRPPRDRLPLRSYVRQRDRLIRTKQRSILHMDKALQQMNIKLSCVLSDIDGISGLRIIRAIAAGERDPEKLAKLRDPSVKAGSEIFIAALSGNFRKEHIFALQQALEQYDFYQEQIARCDKLIHAELEALPDVTDKPIPPRDKDKKKNGKYRNKRKPQKNKASFDIQEVLWRKTGIDITALNGVGDSIALTVFAEVGTDMSYWDTDNHFTSWLKLCPGNDVSAGKRRKSKRQPCYNPVTNVLRMAAMSAKQTDTYLGAHIRRIAARNQKAVGVKAGASKLARQYYFMCKYGWEYHEKGADHYEKTNRERVLKHLQKRAKSMGFTLTPNAELQTG
jgi:transposase